jgi:hypothetical protein
LGCCWPLFLLSTTGCVESKILNSTIRNVMKQMVELGPLMFGAHARKDDVSYIEHPMSYRYASQILQT